MSVLFPLKEIKINESLLGRQGTTMALVLPCLSDTQHPSQKRSLHPRCPTYEAEPSSPIGPYRGRRKRSIPNLTPNLFTCRWNPMGFLQRRLCWGGKILSSNCHVGRGPVADAILKIKFSSDRPLLGWFYFFFFVFAPVVLPH